MAVKMHAYKNGSASAKALRDALGIKMLLPDGKGKWKGKAGDTVINWGSSTPHPNIGGAEVTNPYQAVATAANKLLSHQAMARDDNATKYNLPFTQRKEAAEKWIDEGHTVVCRQKLTGHSGEGIVIAEKKEELVDAPLYTMYKKKLNEYRIHVFNGEIIDVQRKARKREIEDEKINWKVRNLDGGFIFARNNVVAPKSVRHAALLTVNSLGLLHGAVDIGHHKDGTYVYEVNTACGLEGSTLYNYVKAYGKCLGMAVPAAPADYIEMHQANETKLVDVLAGLIDVEPQPVQEPVQEPAPVPEQQAQVHDEEQVDVDFGKALNFQRAAVDLDKYDTVRFRMGNMNVEVPHAKFIKMMQALARV